MHIEEEKEEQHECSCYINSSKNHRLLLSSFDCLAKVSPADMSLMLLRNWSALLREGAGEEESVHQRMDCSISDQISGQTQHKWTLRIYRKCVRLISCFLTSIYGEISFVCILYIVQQQRSSSSSMACTRIHRKSCMH